MATKHTQTIWTRSQVEHALWRYAVTHRHRGADPDKISQDVPQIFRSRIKKLLNLDRLPEMTSGTSVKNSWAFYDGPQRGKGSEERFSTIHVFMLGIALDLLNVGLKQSEVIFFVRNTRAFLQEKFAEIRRKPGQAAPVTAAGRAIKSYNSYPDSMPIRFQNGVANRADFTAWMLVQRFEATEIYPGFAEKTEGKSVPLIFEPKFFFGLELVKEELFSRRNRYRQVVLVELADMALTLPTLLAEAPSRRRGRPIESGRRKSKN